MIVALEKHQLAAFLKDVEKATQDGKEFLLPVRVRPKGLVEGCKCYVSVDGRVRGYVEFVGVVPLGQQRLRVLGGVIQPGWYVVLRGPLVGMDKPSPLRGAAAVGSYRYCEDL